MGKSCNAKVKKLKYRLDNNIKYIEKDIQTIKKQVAKADKIKSKIDTKRNLLGEELVKINKEKNLYITDSIKLGNEIKTLKREHLKKAKTKLNKLNKAYKTLVKINPIGANIHRENTASINEDTHDKLTVKLLNTSFLAGSISHIKQQGYVSYLSNYLVPHIIDSWKEFNITETQEFKKFIDNLDFLKEKIKDFQYGYGLTNNKSLWYTILYKTINSNIEPVEIKDGTLKAKIKGKDKYITGDILDAFLLPFTKKVNDKNILHPLVASTIEALMPNVLSILNGYEFVDRLKVIKMMGYKDERDFLNSNSDESQITKMLNIIKENGLPKYELAKDIGQLVYNELGYKWTDDVPISFKEDTQLALGMFVLNLVEKVSIESTKSNNKDGYFKVVKTTVNEDFTGDGTRKQYNLYKLEINKNIEPEGKIEDIKDRVNTTFSMMNSMMSQILKFDHEQTVPIKAKDEYIPNETIKGTEATELPDEGMGFVTKESNEVIYTANRTFDLFMKLDEETQEAMVGVENENEVHITQRNSVISNNEDLKRRLKYTRMFSDLIKQGFKTAWFMAKNMRTMMDSSINPQDNKVHRFLVKIKNTGSIILDMTNNNALDLFHLAIAQAFDMDPDKKTDNDMISELNEKYINFTKILDRWTYSITDEFRPVFEAISNIIEDNYTKKDTDIISDFVNKGENLHALQALNEIYYLVKAIDNNPKLTEFETELSIESDAITSGMIITIMNILFSGKYNPTYDEMDRYGFAASFEAVKQKILNKLAKGGVYITPKNPSEDNIFTDIDMFGLEHTPPDKIMDMIKEYKKLQEEGKLTHGELQKNELFKDFYNSLATYINDQAKTPEFTESVSGTKRRLGDVKPDWFNKNGKLKKDEELNKKDKESISDYMANNNINNRWQLTADSDSLYWQDKVKPTDNNVILNAINNLLNNFKDDNGNFAFKRKEVKPAMMVKTYGASVAAIIKKLYNTMFIDKFYKDMNKLGKKDITLRNLLRYMFDNDISKISDKLKDLSEEDKKEYIEIFKKIVNTVRDILNVKENELLSGYDADPRGYKYRKDVEHIDISANKDNAYILKERVKKAFAAYKLNEITGKAELDKELNKPVKDGEIDTTVDDFIDLPLDMVEIRKGHTEDYFTKVFKNAVGKLLQMAFKTNFRFLDEFTALNQDLSKLAFNITIPVFFERLESKFLSKEEQTKLSSLDQVALAEYRFSSMGKYTRNQIKEVIKSMIDDGIWYDIPSVFDGGNMTSEKTEKDATGNKIGITTGNNKGKDTIDEKVDFFIENLPAIGPILAHQIDSKTIVDSLLVNDNLYKAMHIFDALLFGVDNSNNSIIKDYNEALLNNHFNYNTYLAMLSKIGALLKNEETAKHINNVGNLRPLLELKSKIYSALNKDGSLDFNKISKIDEKTISNVFSSLGDILFTIEKSIKDLTDGEALNTAKDKVRDILENYDITVLHNYITDSVDSQFKLKDIKVILDNLFNTLDPDKLNISEEEANTIMDNYLNLTPYIDSKNAGDGLLNVLANLPKISKILHKILQDTEIDNLKDLVIEITDKYGMSEDEHFKNALYDFLKYNLFDKEHKEKSNFYKKTANKAGDNQGFKDFRHWYYNNRNNKSLNNNNNNNTLSENVSIETINNNNYADRTRTNANADVTIAIATDFNTPGEKLTKKAVNQNGKLYLPINIQDGNIKLTKSVINNLVEKIKALGKDSIELNIAGNGIYSFNQTNQDTLNKYLTKLIEELLNNGIKIHLIRSGGQTGIDEAGIIAAINNNIPAKVLGTNNYAFRVTEEEFNKLKEKYNLQPNEYKKVHNNYDIFHKQAFEDRFNKKEEPQEQNNIFNVTNVLLQKRQEFANEFIKNFGNIQNIEYMDVNFNVISDKYKSDYIKIITDKNIEVTYVPSQGARFDTLKNGKDYSSEFMKKMSDIKASIGALYIAETFNNNQQTQQEEQQQVSTTTIYDGTNPHFFVMDTETVMKEAGSLSALELKDGSFITVTGLTRTTKKTYDPDFVERNKDNLTEEGILFFTNIINAVKQKDTELYVMDVDNRNDMVVFGIEPKETNKNANKFVYVTATKNMDDIPSTSDLLEGGSYYIDETGDDIRSDTWQPLKEVIYKKLSNKNKQYKYTELTEDLADLLINLDPNILRQWIYHDKIFSPELVTKLEAMSIEDLLDLTGKNFDSTPTPNVVKSNIYKKLQENKKGFMLITNEALKKEKVSIVEFSQYDQDRMFAVTESMFEQDEKKLSKEYIHKLSEKLHYFSMMHNIPLDEIESIEYNNLC